MTLSEAKGWGAMSARAEAGGSSMIGGACVGGDSVAVGASMDTSWGSDASNNGFEEATVIGVSGGLVV